MQQSSTTPQPAPGQIPVSAPEPTPKPKKRAGEGFKSALSTIAILIAAPLLAVALTAFVFQSYEVDGPSMETTLANRDRLIVLKLPRTIAKLTDHAYVPKRGDVIVFKTTAAHASLRDTGEKQLIKRVIGLPGDHVVVKDGVVTVYNNEFPEGFNPDKSAPYGEVIQTTPGNVDITVPKDSVFVCGDNRTNSLDSREIGSISSEDIIGKLIFRIYPLGDAKVF